MLHWLASWLGGSVGIGLVMMLNPIAWIWIVFSRRSKEFSASLAFNEDLTGNLETGHIEGVVKTGLINLATLGTIVMIASAEPELRNPSWSNIVFGSMLAGAGIHYLVHFISLALRRRRELSFGAMAAANAAIDKATSHLDKITPFDPDKHDEDSYAKAMEEIETGQLKKSTWAKSFAVSDGDTSKAQAKYIVFRVKELENK